MAQPTITQVTPSSGPATGYTWVEIAGTNFRTPTVTPTPTGAGTAPTTVSVLFGTKAALDVEVWSSGLVRAQVPSLGGDAGVSGTQVDITITNLDDAGNPMWPLERVTLSKGYTYTYWGLRAPRARPTLLEVLRAFVLRVQRALGVAVGAGQHVEYAPAGATVTELATIPCVAITRIEVPRDREYGFTDNEPIQVSRADGKVDEYRGQTTRMLVMDLVLAGGSDVGGITESLYLLESFLEDIELHPYLDVEVASGPYQGETNQYVIDVPSDPVQVGAEGNAGIVAWRTRVQVRGITSMPDYPTGLLETATGIVLLAGSLSGTAVESVPV